MRRKVATDPSLRTRAEFAAVLGGNPDEMGELGLERIALASLFDGLTPEAFAAEVRDFIATATHPETGRPMRQLVHTPMLELLDELRTLDFTIAIITGGGTEFARAISHTVYGTPPELVVGNTSGDQEMLDWALSHPSARLALLIDHDDAEREYAYQGTSATLAETEAIKNIGRRQGWTIVSMTNDWSTIFP